MQNHVIYIYIYIYTYTHVCAEKMLDLKRKQPDVKKLSGKVDKPEHRHGIQ